MSQNTIMHIPVLVDEVISFLMPKRNGIYMDATVGAGGHTEKILASVDSCRVIGVDIDQDILGIASKNTMRYGERVKLIKSNYVNTKEILRKEGLSLVDGILVDLGYSSLQIDTPARGFSFNSDLELDMRMNYNTGIKARDVINSYSAQELEKIFSEFSQERNAKIIAGKIVAARKTKEIITCRELAKLVRDASPRQRDSKIHPATRVFQSLRIYINRELENLSILLKDAPDILSDNGRIVIISYHSGEDRIVKRYFKEWDDSGICHIITKKPAAPTEKEIRQNPRARSAKLRCAERKWH